jgi:leucyl-tRNA synthetase
MAPVTPHLAEELWQALGEPYSIHQQSWPESDPQLAADEVVTLVVQVAGRVRGKVEVAADVDEAGATAAAAAIENVQRVLAGNTPQRVIYVPGRLVNFVL